MGPFDLSIELRGSGLDVNMPYPFVLDVPVELRLPFVPAISTKGLDSEWELFDDVVGKVYCVLLRVALVDLQRPYSSRIIDGSILVALGLLALRTVIYRTLPD